MGWGEKKPLQKCNILVSVLSLVSLQWCTIKVTTEVCFCKLKVISSHVKKKKRRKSSLVGDQENEQRSKNYLIKEHPGTILIPFKQKEMTKM